MALDMNTDIKALYGVGPSRAAAYARIGVHTVGDLLSHYPARYENRGDVKLLSETSPDSKSAVILTVATEPKIANIKRGMSLLKFRAFDESGMCDITYFNQNYLKDKFSVGSTFRFYGKVEKAKKNGELEDDDLPLGANTPKQTARGKVGAFFIATLIFIAITAISNGFIKDGVNNWLPKLLRDARRSYIDFDFTGRTDFENPSRNDE